MINTAIVDGLVGCQPIKRVNEVTHEVTYHFLLYNNAGNGKSTGIWCESCGNNTKIAKSLKKGQDVVVQGKLNHGIICVEEENEWRNATTLSCIMIKYGGLRKLDENVQEQENLEENLAKLITSKDHENTNKKSS